MVLTKESEDDFEVKDADTNSTDVVNNTTDIALSSDATMLAVGSELKDIPEYEIPRNAGRVWTFRWENGKRNSVGQVLQGVRGYDVSGRSVSLSENGKVMAVGAKELRVFKLNE